MKWNLEKKLIVGGLFAALLMMGGISWISYQNAIQLIKSTERVKKTYISLEHLTEIQATLYEADASRRGYFLFGTQLELNRYNLAIAKLFNIVHILEYSLNYKALQKQRLQQLRSLVEERHQLFQKSKTLFRINPSELSADHPMVIAGNEIRAKLQKVFTAIQSEEQNYLDSEIAKSNSNMDYRIAIEILSTLLEFIIFLAVYFVFYKQLLKRLEAERIQQKLTQEKEISELKLEFLALMSHEFRTPLSVILGSAQLLTDDLCSGTERSQFRSLKRIQSSAKSMKQMLADVLTISRADAGKLEYQPKPLELQSFCLNLVEDMQLDDQHRHSINLIDIGDRTHAWLDEALIYSVLSNLLSNAIKYSPEGSNIEFTLDGRKDLITFKVKDEGVGIEEEIQSVLFEPFRRGANVKNVNGTGLGLALVKRCLDLHQGQITYDSQIGKGTTFIVQIPQSISS